MIKDSLPAGTGALLAAGVLLAHFLLGLWSLRIHSATFDEPMHIAAGYALWKTGDARLDENNPPLAKLWQAAPVVFARPAAPWQTREWREAFHYGFGERFLYWNGNDADRILTFARCANLLLSVLLGALLWRAARGLWGETPAALAVVLYGFSPTLLAHATLATNDFPSVFFSVLALLSFAEFLEVPSERSALPTGVFAFTAFLCKYSALLLWPVFMLCLGAQTRRPGARIFLRGAFVPFLCALAVYFIVFPPGLGGVLSRVGQVASGEHPTYLLGETSAAGWKTYYAVAFLVKSTWAELLVFAGGCVLLLRSKGGEDKRRLRVLLFAVAIYFLAASLGRKQIGIRYILLVYPLIALIAAAAAARLFARRRPVVLLLGGLQVLTCFACAPHFLAYFNTVEGQGVLADSNLDWGQELKELAYQHRRAGKPEVILSYFGTASAEYYGILAQQLRSTNSIQRRHRNTLHPRAEWLVVSATHLEGVYIGREAFAWLRGREPLLRIGGSLLVYDISRDADAHQRIAELYDAQGDGGLAQRERARARILLEDTAGS